MAHKWERIQPLPADFDSLSDPQLAGVVGLWRDKAVELRDRKSYKDFLVRLRRQWAIETGVLERLYTLSEGATKTLIEQGLDAALLTHGDTDTAPGQVMALIRDQHGVIEGLYDFISGKRQLSVSYIKELHQALTTSQETYDARDPSGKPMLVPMVRGDWKKLPNNVELEDGTLFEFCPPEHVASEMDHLVEMNAEYERKGIPPDIRASWLHHRFTLIHPFVDGNGRVARALATLVLLKADWFPLVVIRDDKVSYLKALRLADSGDLAPLTKLFGELQRRAVREALSLSEEIERESNAVRSILGAVTERIAGRKRDLQQQYNKAVTIADALNAATQARFTEIATAITKVVKSADPKYIAWVHASTRQSPKAEYNRYQIVRAAKMVGYFANTQIHPSWVELTVEAGANVRILVAFHGIGHEWNGLLGAVAAAYRKEPSEEGKNEITEFTPLCREPFEIVYSEDAFATEQRYRKWLEDVIALGLDFWQRFV